MPLTNPVASGKIRATPLWTRSYGRKPSLASLSLPAAPLPLALVLPLAGFQSLPLAGCLIAIACGVMLPIVLDFLIRQDAPRNIRVTSTLMRGRLLEIGMAVCVVVFMGSAWVGVRAMNAEGAIKEGLRQRLDDGLKLRASCLRKEPCEVDPVGRWYVNVEDSSTERGSRLALRGLWYRAVRDRTRGD